MNRWDNISRHCSEAHGCHTLCLRNRDRPQYPYRCDWELAIISPKPIWVKIPANIMDSQSEHVNTQEMIGQDKSEAPLSSSGSESGEDVVEDQPDQQEMQVVAQHATSFKMKSITIMKKKSLVSPSAIKRYMMTQLWRRITMQQSKTRA